MTTLDIIKIFERVCDDCIGIILDYIDTPHDILKLIYYNKCHLYLESHDHLSKFNSNTNSSKNIKETCDSVQLLLYEKFYNKVIKNMEGYTHKSNIQWNDVSKLLNETTILSGGSLLQSIYGEVKDTTDIPLEFYYKEYLDIYPKICLQSFEYFINKYTTKKTTTVCTDIDIFTTTPIDIFSSNGIIEYRVGKNLDVHYELYRTIQNLNIIIIGVDIDYNEKYVGDSSLVQIIENEYCDVYVEIIKKIH